MIADWDRLAETLLGHSLGVRPNEALLVESHDLGAHPLVRALLAGAARRRARVLLDSRFTPLVGEAIRSSSPDSLELWAASDLDRLARVDAVLILRGDCSPFELAEVAPAAFNRYAESYLKPVHWDVRIPSKRWCLVRLPGPALAQQCGLGLDRLEAAYRDAVFLDYPRFLRSLEPLAERLGAAREVRISAPGTDLRFSVAGLPAVACDGRRNLPDGEVYTAPVLDSVEGTIRFNVPSFYQGTVFDGIAIEFRAGRAVGVDCARGDRTRLRRILDADEGSSRVGEWAIGCNPFWTHPTGEAIFDEKMAGSHHLALGFAYPDADNGNRSRIHWDLVQRLEAEHGGGSIELDGRPLMVDGRFVEEELALLDPA